MAEDSKIEWTDHTFNPWTGCTKVSPGCDHCYAESWAKRSGHVQWGNHDRKRTTAAYWRGPMIWHEKSRQFFRSHRRRQRIFCASLADVFDNQAPQAWRNDLFTLICSTPSLDWLLLTKRPQNICKMLPADWGDGYHNVWLGTTAEDQARYDQRWSHLAAVPAAVRFVSYEPAIGPLRLAAAGMQPDWLICGGESGGNARDMSPTWAREIADDCAVRGVAFFFKQWGRYANNPLVQSGMSLADAKARDAHGKGGGLLDGHLYRAFPIPGGREAMAAE